MASIEVQQSDITKLEVEAIATVDAGATRRLTPAVPLDDSNDVPQSVVQFVARTKQALVLSDATRTRSFPANRAPDSALAEKVSEGAPDESGAGVLGGPVGFVGSAQSKQELVDRPRGMAYLVVQGRRGGSAMAAAAVNAIASDTE